LRQLRSFISHTKKEHLCRTAKNKEQGKILGRKEKDVIRWMKLHNKELRPLHLTLLRENGVLERVTGEAANASAYFARRPEEKRAEASRMLS
jgi:hypothetical protein